MFKKFALVALAVACMTGAALAAGSPKLSPDELAKKRHNEGLALSNDGDKAAAERDEAKAKKAWEKAQRKLEEAVKANDSLHEAWNQLGYVKRKLGDLDGSVAAYDKALALAPDFTPAIEYLAETNLLLGKIEEAKAAYLKLREADRPLADRLEGAMARFVVDRNKDPAGLDKETLTGLTRWLSDQRRANREAGEGYKGPIKSDY